MRRKISILIGAIALMWPAFAAGDLQWTLSKRDGRVYLQGMSKEEEVDIEFWAKCGTKGAIDLGLGAETNVGEGKGEKVTLTLASAGVTAKVAGVSRQSANFEMTSGTELRATIARTDPLFAVLATGKPIVVTGAATPVTWPVRSLKARAAAFLAACK